MRLMFVDDDECVLGGIERMLFMCDRDWDTEFATSGAEALAMLDDQWVGGMGRHRAHQRAKVQQVDQGTLEQRHIAFLTF